MRGEAPEEIPRAQESSIHNIHHAREGKLAYCLSSLSEVSCLASHIFRDIELGPFIPVAEIKANETALIPFGVLGMWNRF
jgi:hypothetical protein